MSTISVPLVTLNISGLRYYELISLNIITLSQIFMQTATTQEAKQCTVPYPLNPYT